MIMKVLWMTLMLGVAGCTTLPTPTDIDNADYGAYPADFEAIAKNYYREKLSDPDSARYYSVENYTLDYLVHFITFAYYATFATH